MNSSLEWQPLLPADAPKVAEIAACVHKDLPERTEVLVEKIRLFPAGCRKLTAAGNTVGYALAHPWLLNSIPSLDTFLGTLPTRPTCLYVHDIALLSEARGKHSSESYLLEMVALCRSAGFGAIAGTSVYGTTAYWTRLGFEISNVAELAQKLASYGPTAKYIVRGLNQLPMPADCG